ncbi:SWI/SNF complex subunit SWI3A [Primulina eburnea]|uniref:SWI/SNF complex subunit SWI3A n=1 Tax=Primulina eburnea TaxID=1245227 RepID=UPI003C6C7C90
MATMERSPQELELYTIPSYSSWFSWINIHEVERFSLREFFDASSITRSPRIYKEYRDFIISKFREDPSRKLTFTEVRKSLVGDVSVLHKVFTFLEKWGLINFNVDDDKERDNFVGSGKTAPFGSEEEEESWKGRVKVEEGAPYGVRVVAAPNSIKPVVPLPPLPPFVVVDGGGFVGDVGDNGFKWPPLGSYSDVYGELMQQEKKKSLVCGSCEETCDSSRYEYTKDGGLILCEKCFKSGNYEKNMSADDFKLNDSANQASVWTEAETLLLLESMVKHGDDWDLVAKNVGGAKSKLDCISKLIQLPFGNLMVGAADKKFLDIVNNDSHYKQAGLASEESQESVKAENLSYELKDDARQNGDTENEVPAPKRLRTELTSDYGSSLMKQVARISTVVGPHITASAAEAAVTALCYENQCSRGIFDDYDDFVDPKTSPQTSKEKRASEVDHSVDSGRNNQSEILEEASVTKSIIPLNLRTRAAAATALGAAAANAKLLADQEEREIELLMATVLDAQLRKVHRKTKYLDDLESIMEKEGPLIQELEESLVAERLQVLQKICSAGINKTKEPSSVKYQPDTVR